MKTIGKIFILLIALFYGTCSGKKAQNDLLVKANQIHLEAAGIHKRLEKQLDSARSVSRDSAYIGSLDSLTRLVELWESAMVEVPGFEHEHDHSETHHHHNTAPAMTDESMLEYQENAQTAIRELQKSFNDLKH